MTNSNAKGKRGERAWVRVLRDHGYEAKRTQQNKGAPDAPDVESNHPIPYWEVKWDERISFGTQGEKSIYKVVEQAIEEAGGAPCAVAVKKSRMPWLVVMTTEEAMRRR